MCRVNRLDGGQAEEGLSTWLHPEKQEEPPKEFGLRGQVDRGSGVEMERSGPGRRGRTHWKGAAGGHELALPLLT